LTATRQRVVRERIDPRLTASLFANYRSATDALLELVDNAVDARIDGRPLRIDLDLRAGSLTLTAVGGTGMSPSQLERDYLRWGASSKRSGDRIGRYGQGGKAAIGHLGNRFEVMASPVGDARAYAFEDDDYRDRSKLRAYTLHERAKPVDASLGYIHISVGQVDKKLDPMRVRTRLAEVYRPLIASGAVVMRVNREHVAPLPWPVVEEEPISVRAGGRLLRGWYGLLADPPPQSLVSGIRVYHLGRLVGDPAWFGHQGPAQHPGLARLVGEIELPHVPVTMNKNDVDHDSPEWAAVEARIYKLLAPVVRRLSRQEGPSASPRALRTADQVRRILARALRLLESGELFESPNASGTDGPDGQLTLDEVRAERSNDGDGRDDGVDPKTGDGPQPTDADEPAEDLEAPVSAEEQPPSFEPPAPPEDTTDPAKRRGGGSRRGFGDVVVRAMDPRIRSATVDEDGVRRIVINSQFALFGVRDGDLWYQLETALREVCVTIPEATVPEFERKVNELMLVSLSLTERRRQRRRQTCPAKGAW